jgi:hypothetical protein
MKAERRQRDGDRYHQLQNPVRHQWTSDARRPLTAEMRTHRQSSHERRQHRAHRMRRSAHHVTEILRETQLIDQPRRTRHHEQGQSQPKRKLWRPAGGRFAAALDGGVRLAIGIGIRIGRRF